MARTWVLLRGLVRERRHWLGFDAALQAAFPGDKVIALDLPGNGSLNHLDSPLSVARMVQSAREQLAERQLEGPYTLVAISLGGMTAIDWLRRQPDEIRQAFIINASLSSLSPFWQRLRPVNYAGLLRRAVLSRDALARERYILQITTCLLTAQEQQQRARQLAALPPTSTRNAIRQLWAASRFRVSDTRLSTPVVVIRGAGDKLVDPRCSEAIARYWQWPMLTHPQAGHDLPLDATPWLLEVLKRHVV